MQDDKLTSKQRKFAEIYASNGGDAVAAYKEAYGENTKTVKYLKSTAYHKLGNPKVKALIEEIQQAIRAQYIMLAPDALANIVDLAENAESEKVRLEANKEILYGAGMKPAEEVKLTGAGLFGDKTADDMRQLIKAHLEEEEKIEETPSA